MPRSTGTSEATASRTRPARQNQAQSESGGKSGEAGLASTRCPYLTINETGRLKWFLWHGNVYRALQITDDLESDLETLRDAGPEYARLHEAVREFGGYIAANAWSIPNYGERYRAGEVIFSSMAESVVNQVVSKRMVKKQQMPWTPRGAHLLLQVCTRILNDDLADDFHRWHPGFIHTAPEPGELAAAA